MTHPPDQDDTLNPTLDAQQIAALAEHATRVHLADGEPLFRAGEQRGGFFIVLDGAVEIADRSAAEPRTITVHRAGQFTGDIDILSRRRPLVTATARGETTLLRVSSAEIRRIISERPGVGETILRAFIARREQLLASGYTGIRVIGSTRSREAFRIRELLTRHRVPFTWVEVDDPGVAELVQQLGLDERELPAVAVGTQPLLRAPSLHQVAEAVGLRRPPGPGVRDLVIVGAGPAGLAAAVYGASEGLDTLVLDRVAPGGQAGAASKIENYLGFPTGVSGADLTARATLQAEKFGAELSSPTAVVRLDLDGPHPLVHLTDGERVTARCVLIATGADYRTLDVPGRERFDGLGVYYAATPIEVAACRGAEVLVVGGGNSAGQAAMFLAPQVQRVLLLLRGGELRRSMSSYLAERIEAAGNVDVLRHTEVSAVHGAERLEAVEIRNGETGERRTIATPALFTFIGAIPRTDWLPAGIAVDGKGFIRTGRGVAGSPHWTRAREPFLLETSHPGVFAAGDVRLGSIKRVASAVGEGAMVVKFVHELLAEQESALAAAAE